MKLISPPSRSIVPQPLGGFEKLSSKTRVPGFVDFVIGRMEPALPHDVSIRLKIINVNRMRVNLFFTGTFFTL
jgi:hypothetical protein